ncbi:MAG: fumarylacetoacetate hydrolase family protein [Sphingomicrobium sp.]
MKLVTFEVDGRTRAGRLEGEAIVELGASVKEILASGALDRARQATGARHAPKAVKLLAPIPDPGVVLSVGMNYHEHLKEMKTPVPEKPAAITKSVASIIASGQPILLPASNPDMVDWEGEFTVVIGKGGYRIPAAQALNHVAGYTIVNDVSARDWVAPIFQSSGIMGPIHAWEHNLLGKMFPTFCPMGPCIATKDEVPDPDDVRIVTRLNGQVMQDANTRLMIHDVFEQVAYGSNILPLIAGDVIATGSPAGVGSARNPPIFLKNGDRMSCTYEGVGTLNNPVVGPPVAATR